MKLRWTLGLFALGLLPLQAQAQICISNPFEGCAVNAKMAFWFHMGPKPGSAAMQLGPWYQYWPLEAHFQTPAPQAYPYWPVGPQAGVTGPGVPPYQPPAFQPPPVASGPAQFHNSAVQPVGFQPGMPYYWR
jgi:hypothetical protein